MMADPEEAGGFRLEQRGRPWAAWLGAALGIVCSAAACALVTDDAWTVPAMYTSVGASFVALMCLVRLATHYGRGYRNTSDVRLKLGGLAFVLLAFAGWQSWALYTGVAKPHEMIALATIGPLGEMVGVATLGYILWRSPRWVGLTRRKDIVGRKALRHRKLLESALGPDGTPAWRRRLVTTVVLLGFTSSLGAGAMLIQDRDDPVYLAAFSGLSAMMLSCLGAFRRIHRADPLLRPGEHWIPFAIAGVCFLAALYRIDPSYFGRIGSELETEDNTLLRHCVLILAGHVMVLRVLFGMIRVRGGDA